MITERLLEMPLNATVKPIFYNPCDKTTRWLV